MAGLGAAATFKEREQEYDACLREEQKKKQEAASMEIEIQQHVQDVKDTQEEMASLKRQLVLVRTRLDILAVRVERRKLHQRHRTPHIKASPPPCETESALDQVQFPPNIAPQLLEDLQAFIRRHGNRGEGVNIEQVAKLMDKREEAERLKEEVKKLKEQVEADTALQQRVQTLKSQLCEQIE
ncbi:hypothetical protein PTSG_04381 [Salpingoeca rosetta]|uniref:Uncharacterized protein n=1 Tax=Salpingoeca rosetta (strain ATCC 50818 / BSB-021) TaxID=946362 RepID=F2U8D8_SALR5|nr:uncharacterized protein PTSG_04381 [Salpingoeca rosetta]EGD72646.1 hypothetical protein PTSG_04381 [Salpingoeca rosetta]|eukprot:XP_004994469.1 hypothetical protein PTSG_04381 [Salpingoeca rosetta]